MARSTAEFSLAYDGKALRNGAMDVRDLAPALLSMGALCERANHLINEGRIGVSCQVRADFTRGSFCVELELVQGLWEGVRGLLDGESIADANQILKLLGIGGVAGVIPLLRKLRGKKPDSTTKASGDDVAVTIGDTQIVVNKGTMNIYNDCESRRHLENVVRPLRCEGIESLNISPRSPRSQRETITESESEYFRAPPEAEFREELVPETVGVYAFQIAAVPFREGLKWRLENDSMKITAVMEDESFLARMRDGEESFRVGDIMVVSLRTRTYADGDGAVHSEHFVTEVKRHRERPSQLSLNRKPHNRR